MKSREVFFLSIGILIGAAVGRLVYRGGSAPDGVVAERVREKLRRLGADVEVSVSGGEVELRGSVAASDHRRILRAVSRVRGVRAIDDDLALLEIAHGSFLH
jgi:osmotically-inducible protein OsmY